MNVPSGRDWRHLTPSSVISNLVNRVIVLYVIMKYDTTTVGKRKRVQVTQLANVPESLICDFAHRTQVQHSKIHQ